MPITKNAYHRYCFLNRLFQTGHKFTLQQLADRYMAADGGSEFISEETIRKDIYEMRKKEGLKISAKHGLYYYADRRMNFLDATLTDADVSELRRLSQVLQHFDYLPQLDGLQNLILKLRNQVGLLGERPEDVIAFEQVVAQGVSFLTPIYNAIVSQHPLSITYHPFDFSEPFVHVYHPYFLKEFNNRWYAVCFNAVTQRVESVALDRIVSVDVAATVCYRHHESGSFRDYYADLIGVTRPTDKVAERIVLRFTPHRAKYVKSKMWHPSQEIVLDTEGSCDIAFHLIVNKELTARILEFGDDVEVIEPVHLRDEVFGILKRSLRKYES